MAKIFLSDFLIKYPFLKLFLCDLVVENYKKTEMQSQVRLEEMKGKRQADMSFIELKSGNKPGHAC
ncbi:Uncharacterized protein dnm_015960 [Desulfonema magnum]|uniref:Uncharacterized protein n=1 Tax=Desulfonema magnum TaxID=45655 RepID=A0A975BIB7_9BACT|nr:Uncharacterized protein dnm_015960 [Desulfonema magnum]